MRKFLNLIGILTWVAIESDPCGVHTVTQPPLIYPTDQECVDIVRIVNDALLSFNEPVRIQYNDNRITIVERR